jgi:hypothetical protein
MTQDKSIETKLEELKLKLESGEITLEEYESGLSLLKSESEVKPKNIEEIMIIEPERSDAGGDDSEYHGGGFTEGEESTCSISDFGRLLKVLNPPIKDARLNELLQTAKVSRIFPDNYLDKFAYIVALSVLEQEPNKDFDFLGLTMHTQDALSDGYEGRWIADLLEAFGAVKEQDLDKISKDLGLG